MFDNVDFNSNDVLGGDFSQEHVSELLKAMSAGDQTGRDLNGQITAGSSLKVESLEPALKVLTNTDQHIKFWKMIPKQKAYNTVEEYNQLVDYGMDIGIFNNEGETPQFTDSQYRRESVKIKYMGVAGEVTHPFMLVRLQPGVGEALSQEVQNKMMFLTRSVNKSLAIADSHLVSNEFDGIFRQHFVGITGQTGSVTVNDLDKYWDATNVIDARGAYLTDKMVEDASHSVVNDGFGTVSQIIAPPVVFNDYVKQFHESKRVMVNNPVSATQNGVMGQAVNTIITQFGNIDVTNDIFYDYKKARVYNDGATSTKAPAAITPDGSTPVAAVSDSAATKFGSTYAGSYFYAVASKNRFGESAMTILDTSAVSVTATQSVDLLFTITEGSYASESFVIYRTEATASNYQTAKFYPILEISKAELTAGWDGAAAGLVRDRNRNIPNTYTATVFDNTPDVYAFKQLAPMMRMDLAVTSPSRRFMVLLYGSPVLYAPRKKAVIKNIGKRGL